ncbi:hypothetical protein [Ranid herpesvirus 3]|uniref:ORF28 N-terminal domain-containing protein n=1 Tax=Ranid herpesvirus 3 TaxID=1987509 RepID=A0A1X9T5C1_9VIRU|nr:hypothetical protein [Ranid herpesvirus 3]ARR28896.1 hypothetical protein [Ranid herpesvirus 3]
MNSGIYPHIHYCGKIRRFTLFSNLLPLHHMMAGKENATTSKPRRLTLNGNLHVYINRGEILDYKLGDSPTCVVVKEIPPEASEDGFVPVLCSRCFGHTIDDYNNALNALNITADTMCYTGTAAIYEHNGSTYDASSYPSSTIVGDMNAAEIGKYNLELKDVSYMAHPKPALLLWEHGGEPVGTAELYWHVHNSNQCGINALCLIGQTGRASHFFRFASDLNRCFSFTMMHKLNWSDVVVELSTVVTPARAGCFSVPFVGKDKEHYLKLMGYWPDQQAEALVMLASSADMVDHTEPYNPILKKLINRSSGDQPDESLPKLIPFETVDEMKQFLEDYQASVNKKFALTKIMYKHKGNTAIECHEQKAIENFSSINGHDAYNVIAQPQTMSATNSQVQAAPAISAPAQQLPMFYFHPQQFQQPPIAQPAVFPSHGPAVAPPSFEDLDAKIAQSVSASFERLSNDQRKRKAEEELHETIAYLKRANTEYKSEMEKMRDEMTTLSASIELEKSKAVAIQQVMHPSNAPQNPQHVKEAMNILMCYFSDATGRAGMGPEAELNSQNNIYPHNPKVRILSEMDAAIQNEFKGSNNPTPKGIPPLTHANADLTRSAAPLEELKSNIPLPATKTEPMFRQVSSKYMEAQGDTDL